MTTIYMLFVVFALLFAVVSYSSKEPKLVKALVIVSFVVLGLSVEGHYRYSLGKPIEDYPVGKWVYVHHEVQGGNIILWVWWEDTGNKLYSFPFDQDTAEELADAQQQGNDQIGEFEEQPEEEGRLDTAQVLEFDEYVGEYTGETKQ